jgi:hypothetical protein
MIYPGPQSIEPAGAPDGVVVHAYSVPDHELLLEQRLTPDVDLETAATDAAETTAGHTVCLVAYDGDTGARLAWAIA